MAVLLLFSSTGALQAEKSPWERADSLKHAGSIRLAVGAYQEAYEQNPDDARIAYSLATVFAIAHQADSAFYYLKRSLENDSTTRALTEPEFFTMTQDARWRDLENTQLEKVEAKSGALQDKTFTKALLHMLMREHAYRYQLLLAVRQLSFESPVVWALSEFKHSLTPKFLK